MLLLIDAAATDAPLPLKAKVQVDSLTDMVAAVEGCSTQAQVLLAKTKEILGGIYTGVFKKSAPTNLRALVEAFEAEEDPLLAYGRDRSRSGATMALTLSFAHGIEGDFEKAASTYPTGPDGKEVDLKSFSKRAKECARLIADMLEKRAIARAAAKHSAATKGNDASQSAA